MRPAGARIVELRELFSYSLPADLRVAVQQVQRDWDSAGNTARLWNRDASLWTNSDEGQWLGWLDIVDEQLTELSKFKALSAEVKEDGFTHFLLLGMGGSSSAAEAFSRIFERQNGYPELLVLDSIDPAQIRNLRSKIDLNRTLFCVSSKSGTTLETNVLMKYFFEETKKVFGDHAGNHFIAITDVGSRLEAIAEELSFRRVYNGTASIGLRYSAFSDFGLVPHAAAGYDTEGLLKHAKLMVEASKNDHAPKNPGVSLGLILGTAATTLGRDKLTLICSRSWHGIGAWLEQLLGETTARDGRGLIPIDREPIAELENYGQDRIFAYIKCANDSEREIEDHVSSLEAIGEPVIRIVLEELNDIAQTMFQWEIATAVAGAVFRINPFHQPDGEASRSAARRFTREFELNGAFPDETPILQEHGMQLYTSRTNAADIFQHGESLGGVIRNHLDRLKAGDYFALLAFIPMFRAHEEILEQIRKQIVDSKQMPTVVGFGSRFLHGAGQAYKGGPNSGVFLQITCDETEDLPVPDQEATFGVVKAAQARGDIQVMTERDRRILRVHLGSDIEAGLNHLRNLVCAAVEH